MPSTSFIGYSGRFFLCTLIAAASVSVTSAQSPARSAAADARVERNHPPARPVSDSIVRFDVTRWYAAIGSAYADARGYDVLERMCDEAGGRLPGTPANARALAILEEELRREGITPRREHHDIPGFIRGDDVVEVLAPFKRKLRAVALGYTDATPVFDAALVYVQQGYEDQYTGIEARGRIVLVTQEAAKDREEIIRAEAITIAAAKGARAVLFIDTRGGGRTLVGMTNFEGRPSPVPAYSLSLEEGQWLRRLLERGIDVTMRIDTKSHPAPIGIDNIVVRLPGRRPGTIVIGAHSDSWDVGQGGSDNGLGTAVLFDVTRILARFFPENEYAIELVWFNAEEIGLWGARKYWETHKDEPIVAMFNMDMPGSPRGVNAMGVPEMLPFLRAFVARMPGFDLSWGVANNPWTNSDHMPFILGGVPTFTLMAEISGDGAKYYHDFGDTFEKVNRKHLSEAAAVVSVLVAELAARPELPLGRRTREQTIEMLTKHKLDTRLKKQGEWPF